MTRIPTRPPGELTWADGPTPAPKPERDPVWRHIDEAFELAKGLSIVLLLVLVAVRVLG